MKKTFYLCNHALRQPIRFRGATDPVSGAGVKPGELYEYHGREKSLGGWFRDDQPHLR